MSSRSRSAGSRSATPSSRSRSGANGSAADGRGIPAERTIAALRRTIDRLDLALLRALEKRAAAARRILDLKAGAGLPARDRAREREILTRLLARSAGILDDDAIRRLARTALAATRTPR